MNQILSRDELIMVEDGFPEEGKIKQFGSSIGVSLSRPILKNVYGLVVDSEIEIDYTNPPNIVIRPKPKNKGSTGTGDRHGCK